VLELRGPTFHIYPVQGDHQQHQENDSDWAIGVRVRVLLAGVAAELEERDI
jgi:hypothetical protein